MKSRRLPPLNALRAFETLARLGTLARAADELHVTPTAVSKHIKNLEDTLEVPLFERSSGALLLTLQGRSYARTLGRAFEMMTEATELLTESSTRTQLTLRAYTTLLVRWLIPQLPDFRRQHPEVSLRLSTAFDPVDFERDNVDFGVRYGRGNWPGLHSTLLFSDDLVVVANAELAAHFRAQPIREALSSATLLVHTLHLDNWPDWLEAAGLGDVTAAQRAAFDDMSLIYQSALDGLGLGLIQRCYLSADLAEGRLVEISPIGLRRQARGFYLVCRPGTASSPAAQAFIRWIESRRAR